MRLLGLAVLERNRTVLYPFKKDNVPARATMRKSAAVLECLASCRSLLLNYIRFAALPAAMAASPSRV